MDWIPSIVAIILSIPTLSWPYLWDDFDFLVRAKTLHLRDLLPDQAIALYRPLSREVYFGALERLGGGSVVLAHLVNAAIAAACTYLVVGFIRRLAGTRAGLIGGIIFASAAAIPFLVGWISGIQDLLCILLVLVAYHLFDRGRIVLGTLAFGAAILSKETAVALVPALLVLAARQGPHLRRRVLQTALGTALVVSAWASIHPWVHRALTQHRTGEVNEYVAFRGSEVLSGLVRGLPSLVNLSWARQHDWHGSLLVSTFLASLLVVLAVRYAWTHVPDSPTRRTSLESARVLCVGILTIAGPFLLTGAFIAHWSPYYAGISSIGLAMLLALPLSRVPWSVAALTLLAFLWMGASSRVAAVEPEVPAERNLSITAAALRRVEQGFKLLRADLPAGAKVYTYVQAPGRHGVYVSLYRNQPLKVWYDDPTIEVRDPLHLAHQGSEEFLFWISPGLDVFEVDVHSLRPRSSGPRIPLIEFQKTLRAFALGLAGRGEMDRAVGILVGMPQDSGADLVFDRRSAAALLYAVGRDREAEQILGTTDHFNRSSSVEAVRGLVAKPIPKLDFDEGALRAFDISPSDTSAVREIMRWLDGRGYRESAARFARRLDVLIPGDVEAARVREKAVSPQPTQITVPANRPQ
jgi:hypothetical protein